MKRNKANRAELAHIFGITLTTVDAWVRAGMPVDQHAAGKGRPYVFDTADVMRWREQRAADEAAGKGVADDAALRLRKLAAEAKSAELKLAQEIGLVASLEVMERTWSRILSETQSNLRGNLVARLETQLLGETDGRTFKRVALAEIDSVLEALANMDLAEPEDVADIPAMEPAPQ